MLGVANRKNVVQRWDLVQGWERGTIGNDKESGGGGQTLRHERLVRMKGCVGAQQRGEDNGRVTVCSKA